MKRSERTNTIDPHIGPIRCSINNTAINRQCTITNRQGMLLGCGTWLQYVTGNIVVDNCVSFTRRLWFGSAEINR